MRLLICGSRDFDDYELMCEKLAKITAKYDTILVISGGADGADKLAERWAEEHKHPTEIHLPEYKVYGRRAPFERNITMVARATHVVAFWDGHSKGTQHTITLAKNAQLPTRVIESYSKRVKLAMDALDGELLDEAPKNDLTAEQVIHEN